MKQLHVRHHLTPLVASYPRLEPYSFQTETPALFVSGPFRIEPYCQNPCLQIPLTAGLDACHLRRVPVCCAAGPGVPIPCGRPVAASAVDSVAGIQHRSIELADSKIIESSKVAGPAPASRAAEMEVLPAGPMLVIASSRHLVLVIPAIIVAWRAVCMHRVCMARARRQSKSSAIQYLFFLEAWSRPWPETWIGFRFTRTKEQTQTHTPRKCMHTHKPASFRSSICFVWSSANMIAATT